MSSLQSAPLLSKTLTTLIFHCPQHSECGSRTQIDFVFKRLSFSFQKPFIFFLIILEYHISLVTELETTSLRWLCARKHCSSWDHDASSSNPRMTNSRQFHHYCEAMIAPNNCKSSFHFSYTKYIWKRTEQEASTPYLVSQLLRILLNCSVNISTCF